MYAAKLTGGTAVSSIKAIGLRAPGRFPSKPTPRLRNSQREAISSAELV